MIQFWASWFKSADAPPAKYKQKARPAWYSGGVLSYTGYKAMRYAGVQQAPMHCYVCY